MLITEQRTVLRELADNIEKAVVGKRSAVELVLAALLAGGNLLLEDVPGVGKTTLAYSLTRSIRCGFTRIQFTPDTLPSDITGVSVYNMKTGQFEYTPGLLMNNIILADEINRTSPKTQSSLLEAMEEKQVTVDGKTYPLPAPFMVIATQNPMDYLGTYNLPEAQLDRFLMKISIGYPSASDEQHMVELYMRGSASKALEPVTDGETILRMQEEVRQVLIDKDLVSYVIRILGDTRKHPGVALGASPRATLALIRASQAAAYMAGRNYVLPDDILKMTQPVLAHRLILSSEARINKMTADKLLADIIERVRVPVLESSSRVSL